MDNFAIGAMELKNEWNSQPDTRKVLWRKSEIRALVAQATDFMTAPTVLFEQTDGEENGYFSWGGWILKLRSAPVENDRLLIADFARYCRTIYHEIRHAEQFFRIAQGLAAGTLKFPEKSVDQVAQAVLTMAAPQGGRVATQVATIRDKRKQNFGVTQIKLTAPVIAEWLTIPQNVADAACRTADQFAQFTSGPKPAWFKRNSVLLETEDWMRASYSGSLSETNAFAQTGASRKMYRDQPEEHDAHEIGNAIVDKLREWSGRPINLDKY